MAATTLLTPLEFERDYSREPGWEYQSGQAIRKPVPDFFHSILQLVLADLLRRAGYISAPEVELRLTADWFPRPDVAGLRQAPAGRYPTEAPEVIFEILSSGQDLTCKCAQYATLGVGQIYVFDPQQRSATIWDGRELTLIEKLSLPNGSSISVATIWSHFDRALQLPPSSPVML